MAKLTKALKNTGHFKIASIIIAACLALCLCFNTPALTWATEAPEQDAQAEQQPQEKINLLTLEKDSPYLFAAFAKDSSNGMVNNKVAAIEPGAEVTTFIHQNSFMVPLRFLSNTFPIDVNWDATTRAITVKNETDTYIFHADQSTYTENGETVAIAEAQPTIAQDRLFVPLRLMGETVLGCKVDWQSPMALIYAPELTYTNADLQTIEQKLLEQPFGYNGNQEMSYPAMMDTLTQLEQLYPEVVRVEVAGQSFEGRDIPAVYLGKGQRYLYLDASAHARENIASNYAVKLIASYAQCYDTQTPLDGYDMAAILNEFTLVILPMVNPDGVNIAQNGFDAAKDPAAVKAMIQKKPNASYWKATANGVDINGNFPNEWYEVKATSKTLAPASEGYMGDSPASEPETQVMMAMSQKHPYEAFFSFHIAGEVIYYTDPGYNEETLAIAKGLATKVSAACGYQLYPTSGGSGYCNWVRAQLQKPAFTVELYPMQTIYPFDYNKFDTLLWNRAKTIPLAAASYFLQ